MTYFQMMLFGSERNKSRFVLAMIDFKINIISGKINIRSNTIKPRGSSSRFYFFMKSGSFYKYYLFIMVNTVAKLFFL
ncbi:hypothetical protein A5889_001992 [Enterococcus sp. 9D6_DIV0238]|uniref:Uncharacterized protein n=1 Tax=Candidatus Enterococcus dunnyi TaxID=1834192 RepID=A0A200IZI1_9ENTE|nr:hypothetical protein A5889_002671 [Enterococcus sp. 9D6_DIV0238]